MTVVPSADLARAEAFHGETLSRGACAAGATPPKFTRRPGSRLTSGGSSAGAHPAITYFVAKPGSG
jgi:hypothetical protein